MAAILEELENSRGSFMGNRQLTRCLRRKYNLQVRRDTVMKSLRVIDPEGVERRQRRRLKRRRYVNFCTFGQSNITNILSISRND